MSDSPVDQVQVSVQEMIQYAIDQGRPLAEIRRKMARLGVKWSYSTRTQGTRETLRRKRQSHLCVNGCGGRAVWSANPVCIDCRMKNWR